MIDNKLQIPVGFRNILPKECNIKNEILKRISNEFLGYGYEPFESPILEYVDCEKTNMRYDLTLGACRIFATDFSKCDYPIRLYSLGNVFKNKEVTEAGAWLIGDNSFESDAEAIILAVKSILKSGVKDFKINVGNIKLLNALLDEFLVSDKESVKSSLASGEYGFEDIAKKCDLSDSGKEFFENLSKLVGKKEVFGYIKEHIKNEDTIKILDEFESLYETLVINGVERYVYLDLKMVGCYTGIVFKGYEVNTEYEIVSGGRQDNILIDFGKDVPFLGFVININNILSILGTRPHFINKIKTLIAWSDKGRKTAYDIGSKYRQNGMIVQNSFITNDFDKNFEYAKKNNIAHMLYFVDNENIKVVSLLDEMGGYTVDAKISDLVLPEKGEV